MYRASCTVYCDVCTVHLVQIITHTNKCQIICTYIHLKYQQMHLVFKIL